MEGGENVFNYTKQNKKTFTQKKQATYRFDFGRVELPYESYSGGGAARLTYAVRASVKRPYGGSTAREWGLAVRNARDTAPLAEGGETSSSSVVVAENPTSPSTSIPSPPIKMEVGIEDCLHIEFEYDKASYHLSDVVLGRISFLLVRIRLKHMELEVRTFFLNVFRVFFFLSSSSSVLLLRFFLFILSLRPIDDAAAAAALCFLSLALNALAR